MAKEYTPEVIQAMKKQLPHGAIKLIASEAGYSPEYVSLFFTGTRKVTINNNAIIKQAQKIIREFKN